jgi:hypothetical protein
MRRHFVYYRVPEARLGEAGAALRAVHGGVELLRRPGSRDGLVTLMEIYAADDLAQATAIEAAARAALAPWIVGERHVEVFEPLDAA